MSTLFHSRSLKPFRVSSKDRARSSDSSYGRRLRFARFISGRFRRTICLAIVLTLPICCKQKTYMYVGNDYWANPPTVTNGDPQVLHLVGATTYDFNSGLPKYTEFPSVGRFFGLRPRPIFCSQRAPSSFYCHPMRQRPR